MPDTIWNDVVFPDIADISALVAAPPLKLSSTSNYTFPLDALRPLLSCEVVKDDDLTVEFRRVRQSKYRWREALFVQSTPPLLPGFQFGGMNGSRSYYNFSSTVFFTKDSSTSYFTNETSYMGNFYDLHIGPWNGSGIRLEEYGETRASLHRPDNPAGCPSIGVIFAKNDHHELPEDYATAILCSQKMQEVQVSVTYSGLDLRNPKINTDIAPIASELSTRNLTNGTDGIDSFPYRVQTYLQNEPGNPGVGNISTIVKDYTTQYDDFTDHLFFGPNGTAANDLLGRANRQKFVDAVQNLYARYMRLVVDMRFSQPIARAEIPSVMSGTAYSFTSRLQLNSASKLTMQIMLGVMSVLGVLTFLLTDLRGTLPRKPTSIASRMALLAGSDLCDENKFLPKDAMWMSSEELDKVFDG